jgi:cysteine desulfurase
MTRVYFDYNASTPVAPSVAAAMRPLLEAAYGNPSSGHWASAAAKAALDTARAQVADLLGCAPDEVVFTSGGSEADNLAIKGAWFALRDRGDHIITTEVEHPAVLEPCRFLERLGAKVTYLPVDRDCRVDPEAVRRAITPRTVLISVMHANSETGAIQPIAEIAEVARAHGVRLHTDAAQSAGKIPVRVADLGVDLLTLVGHKLYAPKGVGALYVRRGTALEPLIHGAGHEGGRRAGTESALLAAGFGAACAMAMDLGPMARVQAQRDRLWQSLRQAFGDGVALNGPEEGRLPNTLNVAFVGRLGAEVLAAIDGVAASTGMACHQGRAELSPVLAAMGVPEHVGLGAVRFSLGRDTTDGEIDELVRQLARLRTAEEASA